MALVDMAATMDDVPWYRPVLPLALTMTVLVTGMALFAARAEGPSDATVVAISDRVATDSLVVESVLDPGSALRPRDVVVEIDGRPVDRMGAWSPSAGDVLTYVVQRSGATLAVPVRLSNIWLTGEWVRRNWSALVLAAGLLVMGIVVFRRRPTDPAAVTLLAIGALAGVGAPAFLLGGQVIDLALGRDLVWYAIGEAFLAASWAAWLLFVLLFPEPVRGWPVWRLVLGCVVALVTVDGLFLVAVLPGAPSATVMAWRVIEWTYASGYLFPLAMVLVVFGRMVGARGTPSARYLSWILAAFAFGGGGYYLVWQLPVSVRGAPLLDWDLVPLAFLPCVLTLAAAVLRFGLFEFKAVARRAVVYTTLTVAVIVGYAAIVAAAGSLVTTGPIFAPPLVATVVIAVLFQPLKDRVQRSVTRLMYGARDEPYLTLARLGEHLENTMAGPAVLDIIADTVAMALKVPYVAAELCTADGALLRRTAKGHLPPVNADCATFRAVSGGVLVGRLVVAPRTNEIEFGRSELRLLTDLVRQAAPALQAVQLAVELVESRQKLIRAGAEERRRVQRDLHDGVGPALAGLRMQVGAARALLTRGATDAALSKMEDIERHVVDCAGEVRDLLVVLRSPLLDSLGLVGALRHQAQRLGVNDEFQISVEAPAVLPTLPAAVEEATLAIGSEAMTNAVRHSGATRCLVTLCVTPTSGEELTLAVRDNGRGLSAASRAGSGTGLGLRGMRRRAVEIGGSCSIGAGPAGGTEVCVSFPLTVPS